MYWKTNNIITYKSLPFLITTKTVGGKGWNLFRLRKYGIATKPWIVISTNLFDQFISDLKAEIEEIINGLDFSNPKQVEESSLSIKQLIVKKGLNSRFLTCLYKTMNKIFGEITLFAVRSSLTDEDSANNSFAGQMDSFLNVKKKYIEESIKMVWASAYSPRALLYRYKKKISFTHISSAVIIQEMVQSEASGIIFTKNPETHVNECIISAGYGLGEGIVGDIVETDTYTIDRDTNKIQKKINKKELRLVIDCYEKGRTRKEVVPKNLKSKAVLTDDEIDRLLKQTLKMERKFGFPIDVEWAMDKKREIFFLQSRPITFKNESASASTLRIWDNSNIVESYSGITLPLTFSFIRECYETIFQNAVMEIVSSKKAVKNDVAIFKNMVGLQKGRVYYNLLNWYKMLSFLPGFKNNKPAWDQMIGIKHTVEFPERKISVYNSIFASVKFLYLLLSVKRTAMKFHSYIDPLYKKFQKIDVSHMTPDQLVDHYDSLWKTFMPKWHLTLYNDVFAMKYYEWLKSLCSKWGLSKYDDLHNKLLCGEREMESLKPLHSLLKITAVILKSDSYQHLLRNNNSSTIWKRIQTTKSYAELKQMFDSYLTDFGDRGIEELKLEKESFHQNPELLIDLVKKYCRQNLSINILQQNEIKIRKEAEQIIRKELSNPFKRFVFRFVLKNARRSITNRENMRFARTRNFGLVRNIFRQISQRFVEQGILKNESDIFYLTVNEIFDFIRGTSTNCNLASIVKIRKAEYASNSFITLPDRFQTIGIPYLNKLNKDPKFKSSNKSLQGTGCSSGVVKAEALVVIDPSSVNGKSGHILVARSTDPGWIFLMVSAKGIIVEKGSVLSHSAIIGRELGIPTIIGVTDATGKIPDGAIIEMDGSNGEIQWQ
ncbi:MAG: hypothetical protein IH852_15425 [Bacteroidetes bacterium]|nr:hypothetical protein [Bacteroidota bacterium]